MNSSLFQETIKFLKKDPLNEKKYYLTEPHLLYMSAEQANAYIQITKNRRYFGGFHRDTLELIRSNLGNIFGQDESLSLIDLGPGYPDKTLPIAQFMKMNNKPVYYYPVDICEEFLRIAGQAMMPYVSSVDPLCTRFEECQVHFSIKKAVPPVYVMIGITFMNFLPHFILDLLKQIAGTNGKVLLAAELITDKNSKVRILSCYQNPENEAFCFGPLRNLGLPMDCVNYKVEFNNSSVESQFILKRNFQYRGLQLRRGDHVVTAVSYRYSLNELKMWLAKYFKNISIYLSKSQATALVICSSSK